MILLEKQAVFWQQDDFIYYFDFFRTALNIKNGSTFDKKSEIFKQLTSLNFYRICIKMHVLSRSFITLFFPYLEP